MKWYLKALKQYADFSGRARRKEYWMFTLFNVLFVIGIAFVLGIIEELFATNFIALPLGLYVLAVFLPSLAAVVRRLHDINKSGWYILVRFIPLIGPIWLLVLLCENGSNGVNQFGEDPKVPISELNDIGVTVV